MSDKQDLPQNLKILAIGDCNTAGTTQVSGSDTVPGQFAKLLEQQGIACSIQNLGYTMSTSREGLSRSLHEAGNCDVLLLNFGLVDAWITSLPKIYISYYPDNPLKKIFRKLLKSLKKRLRGERIRKLIPVGHVVPVEEFSHNISHIINNVKQKSPGATIVLWGTVPVDGDEPRNTNLKIYDDILRHISMSKEGLFLDTAKLLEGKSTKSLYLDTVHLSIEGTAYIGKKLFELFSYDDQQAHP